MNANTPRLDPLRAEAMRRILLESVRGAAPAPRRRRAALVASIAVAAVVVVIGGGVVAHSLGNARTSRGGGQAVAPPATSSSRPIPPTSPSVTPPAGGVVDPAGTASPAPIPTTPSVDLSDPSSWVITTAGIGPLTLGGSQTSQGVEASRSYVVTAQSYSCPVDFYVAKAGVTGPALTTEAFSNDKIDLIMIGSLGTEPPAVSPKTPSGVGLGATKAELLATYPQIEEISTTSGDVSTTFGEAYGIRDSQGRWLSFELDEKGRVGEINVSYTEGANGEFC